MPGMELGDVARALFYIWLFVALGVWAVRLYNKAANRKGGGDEPTAEGATNSSRGSVLDPTPRRARGDLPEPERSGSRTPTTPTDEPGDLVKAVIREEMEKKRRLEAGAGADENGRPGVAATGTGDDGGGSRRGGLFAPTGERDTDGQPQPTVAEALEGIALPCDLVPTLMHGDRVDPYQAAFVTTGFSPATVAAKFADELERLDYTIRSEGDSVAVARRASGEVRIEVYEDAASARVEGQLQFPYVAKGSVAIVVST